MARDDVFIEITNKDIYDKLEEIERDNNRAHSAIISRQDRTNGSVKLNKWVATTALSISLIALGFLFNHIVKFGG